MIAERTGLFSDPLPLAAHTGGRPWSWVYQGVDGQCVARWKNARLAGLRRNARGRHRGTAALRDGMPAHRWHRSPLPFVRPGGLSPRPDVHDPCSGLPAVDRLREGRSRFPDQLMRQRMSRNEGVDSTYYRPLHSAAFFLPTAGALVRIVIDHDQMPADRYRRRDRSQC